LSPLVELLQPGVHSIWVWRGLKQLASWFQELKIGKAMQEEVLGLLGEISKKNIDELARITKKKFELSMQGTNPRLSDFKHKRKERNLRILCLVRNSNIILLHAFDKDSRETPLRDKRNAERRAKQLNRRIEEHGSLEAIAALKLDEEEEQEDEVVDLGDDQEWAAE
jgi:phage-related protein